jgi:uncharacterized protein YkwD
MRKIYTLSVKALLVIFIATILFVGGDTFAKSVNFEPNITGNTLAAYPVKEIELRVFNLINAERSKRNLRNLTFDSGLSKVARSHSLAMAKENFFSHYGADGSTVVDRAKDFKITNWRKIGENLFTCRGYDDPETVAIRGWLKSPSHRKNMLSGSWTATGIGVALSKDGDIYITQVFVAY